MRIARRLFNRRGFDGVSIDDVMAEAGLTHGGFYSYFVSKGELYALAVRGAWLRPPANRRGRDTRAIEAAQQLICAYLGEAHFEDDDCCPMVSLPAGVAGHDNTVRRVFGTVFRQMVALFEHSLERESRAARNRAVTITTLCVGAMVIARALEDRQLARELRRAAAHRALELGGWKACNGRV